MTTTNTTIDPHHEEHDGCDHGATGKPCKPDPQPDHGKDCQHHGNHGGINEDHCATTTTQLTHTTTTVKHNTTTTVPNHTTTTENHTTTTSHNTTTTVSPPKNTITTKVQPITKTTTTSVGHANNSPSGGNALATTGAFTDVTLVFGLMILGVGTLIKRIAGKRA